jgi:DNA-binding response OmpR family regulator
LLPAVLERLASTPPMPTAPELVGSGRTVLVVDDEAGIRTVLVRILTRHGFRCVAAVDGHDGLVRFRATPERYAAAVLDVMMPGMNGFVLAREIRRLAPQLPILLSSGLSNDTAQDDTRHAMAEIGLRTLLRKPYGEEELIAALAAELSSHPAVS